MAFLGSVGKSLGIGNLNKGKGWEIARIVFPPILATEVAVKAAGALVNKVQGFVDGKQQLPAGAGSNYQIYGFEGSQGSGYYAPPPAYSVYFGQEGGYQQWDSSTSLNPSSIPLAAKDYWAASERTSSEASWEDLLAQRINQGRW